MSELPAAVHEDQLATQPYMKKKKKKPLDRKNKIFRKENKSLGSTYTFSSFIFFPLKYLGQMSRIYLSYLDSLSSGDVIRRFQ